MNYDRDMKIERISGTITTDVGGDTETAVNYTVINDYANVNINIYLVYTEFIIVRLSRKLITYI